MILFHKDRTLPRPAENTIFVFGSNLAGIHGAGAALVARRYFGAQSGVGAGLTGRSYAIPTKDRRINVLAMPAIIEAVNDFINFVQQNPSNYYFVTRVGCGLAGFSDQQIAPLFIGAARLSNVSISFAEQWWPFLSESANLRE